MSALSISVPYPVFSGQDGLPLDNGYVWIGTANLYPITNQIAVYFDEALTIQATQPLRTINGYISNSGTPAQVYVDAVNFSILVQDSKGSMIYNFPDGTGIEALPNNACGLLYTPDLTGAITRPTCEKLEELVSVLDFGAVGDGVTDDTAAIQAALDASIHVYMPDGTYLCNTEPILQTDGNFLEGSGNAVIVQNTYGFSGVQIRAANCTVKNVIFKNLQPKTELSQTLANRYEGNVARSRASAIYVAAGSDNFTCLQCESYGFVIGVNFTGGQELAWRTNIASTYTTTSFVLAPQDQKPEGYWIGAVGRVMTVSGGSTDNFIVTGYTSSTNTITFATQASITATNFYYYLYKGLLDTGRVEQFYMDKLDFGVLIQYSKNIVMTEMVAEEIEQTQQVNVRPHTIYNTSYSENITATNLTTYKNTNGQAYKFRGVTNLFLGNAYATDNRGCFTIESCTNASAVDCANFEAGLSSPTEFAPSIGDITNSKNVTIQSCSLVVATNYNASGVADNRPYGFSLYSSGTVDDVGTTQSINQQINIKNISVVAGNNVDTHYGVLIDGDAAVGAAINNYVNIDGLVMYGNGLNAILQPIRVIRGQNTTCQNLQVVNNGSGTVSLQADAVATNTLFLLNSDLITPTITNTGTNTVTHYVAAAETGTWTPVVIGSTTAGTNTYTAQIGTYYKIEKQVTVRVRLDLSGALSSTGSIRISGLPYPIAYISGTTSSGFAGLPSSVSNVTLSSGEIFNIRAEGGLSYLSLSKISNTGQTLLTDAAFGSGFATQFALTYITD